MGLLREENDLMNAVSDQNEELDSLNERIKNRKEAFRKVKEVM